MSLEHLIDTYTDPPERTYWVDVTITTTHRGYGADEDAAIADAKDKLDPDVIAEIDALESHEDVEVHWSARPAEKEDFQ